MDCLGVDHARESQQNDGAEPVRAARRIGDRHRIGSHPGNFEGDIAHSARPAEQPGEEGHEAHRHQDALGGIGPSNRPHTAPGFIEENHGGQADHAHRVGNQVTGDQACDFTHRFELGQEKVRQGQGHEYAHRQAEKLAGAVLAKTVANIITGRHVSPLHCGGTQSGHQGVKDDNDRHHEARGHDETETGPVRFARVTQQGVARIRRGVERQEEDKNPEFPAAEEMITGGLAAP